MAWENKVAHQITRGYLSRRYKIPAATLLADPTISELPFYNPEVSDPVRKNEMRIVAGRLLRFLVDLNLQREEDSSLDKSFDTLVNTLTNGSNPSSQLGLIIDDCFKCRDEV